ncbi:MAG: glycine--tRNA ligase [Desulfurococcales archaeon]|nr:glycine--tRNA ligase [Desulfurococcales archaeon]MCE4605508.1 glycine--tRNA ligase [Desulfurococcales archaeon]
MPGDDKYSKIMELARRRGFFWPSYEIYGGVAGFYDLGPYGVLLKRRIIEKWRRIFVHEHSEYVVEIESPIVGPSRVYEASGHVESFTDPIVACTKCGRRYRADHLIEEKLGVNVEGMSPQEMTRIIRENNITCPVCSGPLGEVKLFNLLFKTQIGPYEGSIGYLRPELAQGMFVAFKRVYEAMRSRIPIGIAQIGRVGRNEISPRQAMMRLREFTIMEIEYFIDPEDREGSCPFLHRMEGVKMRIHRHGAEEAEWYTLEEAVNEGVIIHPCLGYWMAVAQRFVESLGVPRENMFFEEKGPEERAHYSSQTFDQMVKVSRWGWVEVSGHSYRGDFDLSRHMKYSGQDLTVFKPYPKPVKVRVRRVIVDRAYVGRNYKSRAPEILREAQSLDPDTVERMLEERGHIEVAGARIPRDHVRIVEVEEKVSGRRFIPHVVEPSFGTDRNVYVAFEYAYREKGDRVILAFPRDIAPVQATVLPLVEKDEELKRKARSIYQQLLNHGYTTIYDDTGSIGRRYARSDEIGVPAAITIDYQTLEDNTVTLRDRDTWKQARIPANNLPQALHDFIYKNKPLEEIEKHYNPQKQS